MEAVLSYQSVRSGWKIIFLFVAVVSTPVGFCASAVALAGPTDEPPTETDRLYRDERRGFSLELADGWALAPVFGETRAMVFERRFSARRGGRRAALSIRPIRLDRADADVWAELQRVWGPRRGRAEALVPVPTEWRYRYRPQSDRRGEAHLLTVDGARFLVTLSAARQDMARFRADAAARLRTLRRVRPTSTTERGRGRRGDSEALNTSNEASTAPAEGAASAVVGRWVRADGPALVLFRDGRYRLADISGRYAWRAGRLLLTRTNGKPQAFHAELRADRLVLKADGLPAPLVFDRFRPERALAGVWVAVLPKGTLVLRLGPDGRFALGAHRGRWSVHGARLELRKSETEVLAYTWALADDGLILSGGDLDRPLKMARKVQRGGQRR